MVTVRISVISLLLLLVGCGSMDPLKLLEDESNVEPPAELVELKSSLGVRKLWSTSVGSGSSDDRVKLVPYVQGNRVYVADREGMVKALDSGSGRIVWSVEKEGLEISGGPGAGGGLVLIGTSNGEVVALSEQDGSEKWRARVSSEVLSVPKIAMGVVVVHTIDGKLYAMDASDGKLKWVYDRSIPVLTLHGNSSPVISGSSVICGFASGKLISFDLESGQQMWESTIAVPTGRSELERMVDIDGDPVVHSGMVYVATYQGQLAAVVEGSGDVVWRRKFSSYAGLGTDSKNLYVSDAQDMVWAIDPKNSSSMWKQSKLHGRKLSAPAVLGGYVVVGDFEGYLHWMSPEDGHMVARTRVGDQPITTSPVIDGKVAYVLGDGGELAAIAISGASQ
ncbi:MAG: outer membrane protein assembly factor BamB [Gammaproteobacteria bacterium]|nr:outer membrane protein assembly factor BamB [Gammaproteobacteria bacterium]